MPNASLNDEVRKPEGSIRASVQVKTKLNWVFMGLTILFCFGANLPQMEAGDVGGGLARITAVMLLPFLVAFVLRGRKGDWKGFSKWFFWVTIILLLGTTKR